MAQPTTRRAIITARMDTLSTPGPIGGIDIGHEAIGDIIEGPVGPRRIRAPAEPDNRKPIS